MTFHELQAALVENPFANISLIMPDGNSVPPHFHVTEVGRVQKDFIDCGGTIRSTAACVLQTWVAGDVEHRISASKLGGILQLALPLLRSEELPVEIEFDSGVISQYPVSRFRISPDVIELQLATKHTACLAPERCGLNVIASDCCSTPGCC